LAQVII